MDIGSKYENKTTRELAEMAGEIICGKFTRVFMQATPAEWQNESKTAIQVKMPMPEKVIDLLKEMRSAYNAGEGVGIDFNELLSMYLTHLIVLGIERRFSLDEKRKIKNRN